MLGSENLVEIGSMIVSRLAESGYNNNAVLSLQVEKDMLQKIDEDVFYRMAKKEDEFKHSDEVVLKFDKLQIVITEKKEAN